MADPTPTIVITLCPTLESRQERKLRRGLTALGAKVDTTNTSRWNIHTTHTIAIYPTPSPKYLCATISSTPLLTPSFLHACISASSLTLDPSPHTLNFLETSPSRLPARPDALWAGRIWPPAYTFWARRRALSNRAPLSGHRVLLLGQLRPRGAAGLAAPTNRIVADLLLAGGAAVVSEPEQRPTFAIVAPGLDRARSNVLARLLDNDVLCLGSAFVVDLVARVSADPKHYTMFEEQRSLCGPLLDTKSCIEFLGVLPVTLAIVENGSAVGAEMVVDGDGAVLEQGNAIVELKSAPNVVVGKGRTTPVQPTCCRLQLKGTAELDNKPPADTTPAATRLVTRSGKRRAARKPQSGGSGSNLENAAPRKRRRTRSEIVAEPLLPCDSNGKSNEKLPNASVPTTEQDTTTLAPRQPLALRRSSRLRRPTYRDTADYKSPRKRPRVDRKLLKEASSADANFSKENISADDNISKGNALPDAKVGSPIIIFDDEEEEAPVQHLQAQKPCEEVDLPVAGDRRRKSSEQEQQAFKALLQLPSTKNPVKGPLAPANAGPADATAIAQRPEQLRCTPTTFVSEQEKQGCDIEMREDSPVPLADVSQGTSGHCQRANLDDTYARKSVSDRAKLRKATNKKTYVVGTTAGAGQDSVRSQEPVKLSHKSIQRIEATENQALDVTIREAENSSIPRLTASQGTSRRRRRVNLDEISDEESGSYRRQGPAATKAKKPVSSARSGLVQDSTSTQEHVRFSQKSKQHVEPSENQPGDIAMPETDELSVSRPAASQVTSRRRRKVDLDNVSDGEAVSELVKSRGTELPSILLQNDIHSIEDASNFVLKALGGAPCKGDIDYVINSLGRDAKDDKSSSSSQKDDSNAAPATKAEVQREIDFIADEDEDVFEITRDQSDARALSPEDNAPATGSRRAGIRKNNGMKGETSQLQRKRERPVDMLTVPVPSKPIQLSQILGGSCISIEHASWIEVADGNEADDRLCQSEIEYVDWLLGAEQNVGFVPLITESEEEDNVYGATARRVCMSLSESGALEQYGSVGCLGDSPFLSLSGICVRLADPGLNFDARPLLVPELLSLRDKQLQSGLDSLAMISSAADIRTVPLRHQAVGNIWSSLIQATRKQTDLPDFWPVFNKACDSRLQIIFSTSKLNALNGIARLRKGLKWMLETSVTIGYSFAIQGDLKEDFEQSSGTWQVCPENWELVCQCLNGFSGESGTIVSRKDDKHEVLQDFLSKAAVHLAGRVWEVSDQILAAISKTIVFLSKNRNVYCYCMKPALFVTRFQGLSDGNNERAGLSEFLKTPCDCFFFLSWLFVNRGSGNPMKRAMSVIRKSSALANSSSLGFSRAVNHHVGLILSVADSLAGSNDNGEYLLCRTLTSKCPRLETVLDRSLVHGNEDNISWRSTVDAISVRCRLLLTRRNSVHIYINWLAESVVGNVHKFKKNMERQTASVAQREATRVQDSVFANLALLTLGAIQEINEVMYARAVEDERRSDNVVRMHVEHCGKNVASIVRFARDLVAQMRSNPEEAISKNRGSLLCSLLEVIAGEIKLTAYAVQAHAVMIERADRQDLNKENRTLEKCGFVSDQSLERLLVSVIGSELFTEDYSLALCMKRSAGRALGQLLELQGAQQKFIYKDEDVRKIETLISQGRLDMHGQIKMQTGKEVKSYDAKRDKAQNRAQMEFWGVGFAGSWASAFLRRNGRLIGVVTGVVIDGVTRLVGEAEEEVLGNDYKVLVRQLVRDVGKLEEFGEIFGSWVSRVHELGDGADGEACVASRFVVSSLRRVANSWAAGQTVGVVRGVCRTLGGMMDCCGKYGAVARILMLQAEMFGMEGQLGGFRSSSSASGWTMGWMEGLLDGVDKATRLGWGVGHVRRQEVFREVQRCIMGGLCMLQLEGRDFETRVAVVRLVEGFCAGGGGSLEGMWMEETILLERIGMEGKGRMRRNARDWHLLVFHTGVGDVLYGDRQVGDVGRMRDALERLAEAARIVEKDGERLAGLGVEVRRVLGRIRASGRDVRMRGHVALTGAWTRVEGIATKMGWNFI